jgi:hypothetical protein
MTITWQGASRVGSRGGPESGANLLASASAAEKEARKIAVTKTWGALRSVPAIEPGLKTVSPLGMKNLRHPVQK